MSFLVLLIRSSPQELLGVFKLPFHEMPFYLMGPASRLLLILLTYILRVVSHLKKKSFDDDENVSQVDCPSLMRVFFLQQPLTRIISTFGGRENPHEEN